MTLRIVRRLLLSSGIVLLPVVAYASASKRSNVGSTRTP
jgi:hypothetical protein